MAKDPKASRVVFNYAGGAATMTRGLADALLGTTWQLNLGGHVEKTVSVKAHTRQRVIGGPTTNVASHTYTFKAWPTMDAEQAQGGQSARVILSSGDSWTVRVSGPMSVFCDWLNKEASVKNFNVISERGTIYGPFGQLALPGTP
jgi:hypothetical protein